MATKTQSKTTTATLLASKLKLDNILQLTLVQSTLEANFKAILQALSEHESDISKAKEDSKNNGDKLGKIQLSNQALNNEIEDLKDLVSKLSNQNQYIKLQLDQRNSKGPNPESEVQSNTLQDLLKELNTLKERTQKLENNSSKSSQTVKSEIDKLRKQLSEVGKISDMNNRLKQLQKLFKDLQAKNKDMNNKIKKIQSDLSQTNQHEKQDISQLLQDVNKKLNQFIGGEYRDNCGKVDTRLEDLEKQLQQAKASLEEQKRIRNKLSQQLWKIHDAVSKFSQNNFQKQLSADALKQIKREIAEIHKRLNELTSTSMTKNNGFNDTTVHQSPSKWKVDTDSPKQINNGDLRQEMLERLKQLKSDIMKNMKKIDLRTDGDSGYDKKRLDALQQAILRLDHLISDKAGLDSVKKLVENLENKISYIYNLFMGESEEDACIARKNWVCLSCDKKLEKYQGRIGHHLVNDKLKVRTLDQDTVGGGMTLKSSKSRVDLPNVKTAKRL